MQALPRPPLLTHFARTAWLTLIAFALAFGAGEAQADPAPSPQAQAQSVLIPGPGEIVVPSPAPPPDALAPAAQPASGLDATLEQQVRALALGGAAGAPAGVMRFEVIVGQLDPRLHLAPCQQVEPYLPTGTRLWGKARIGLRCVNGPSRWNVFLPITVKAFGRGLVATAGATAGTTLRANDVASAEVDLAEEMTPALTDPDLAVGRSLTQSLRPGQTLRQAHLKPRLWFSAGDTVKVVAVGEGFSLEGEAQALSNGVEGQPARLRTESGRILTGQPAGERRVEIAL